MVADEVGLGKTIVAQQLVRRFIERNKDEPAVVIYVCGSLPLASQNSKKLLEALDDPEERKRARSTVDRITMIPLATRPASTRLHLYAITPTTSLPQLKGPQYGRKKERALLQSLVNEIGSDLVEHITAKTFQGTVRNSSDFRYLVNEISKYLPRIWHDRFAAAVRKVLNLQPGTWLLRSLMSGDNPKLLFKLLRQALALAALEQLSPDLIIFDEFQGYAEKLTAKEETLVVKRLRGDVADQDTAHLLLSATPYKMNVNRAEDPSGTDHQKKLLDLLRYLFAHSREQAIESCRVAFGQLHSELWAGRPESKTARQARSTLESQLSKVMSRTERFLHLDFRDVDNLTVVPAPLDPVDLQSFVSLAQKTKAYGERSILAEAVALWSSVPFPLQTLSSDYHLQKLAGNGHWPLRTPRLTKRGVGNLNPIETLPHPRLRALSTRIPSQKLAIPWLPPSFPWWNLGDPWREAITTKMLLFSHYRATPPAIAALLSYGVETAFPSLRNKSAKSVNKKRHLRVSSTTGLSLLALFHPSEWIIENTDPTRVFDQRNPPLVSVPDVEKIILGQLRRALSDRNIKVRRRKSRRPVWKLLAKIDFTNQHFHAWQNSVHEIALRWQREAAEPINWISESELRSLAQIALRSPGVVLGRSLRRHAPETDYASIFNTAWSGFRTYIDRPWFAATLMKRGQPFVEALTNAVVEGNLEAVLDEHLWLEKTLNPPAKKNELAKRLQATLSRVRGSAQFQKLPERLRCHAALPFTTTMAKSRKHKDGKKITMKDDELSSRPDDVRQSFNSPFWPHVITTTSVGQEGLDFHYWCRTVVHWDLCSSPVELEQREGRVQRYAGLNVRQAIAKEGIHRSVRLSSGSSPWDQLESWANENLADDSGLSPWWLCKNAETECVVFHTPASEQNLRRERLQQRRLLYRLTLGQPNQADLLDSLTNNASLFGGDNSPETIRAALLNLSPYSRVTLADKEKI
jgi:Helicase conserved C-terminal domain